ncbi:MAG: hypothetical protein ACXV5Q_07055 [Frankiaceae bacterium]
MRDPAAPVEYAFCEPVEETLPPIKHIRILIGEDRHLRGGVEGEALCGRNLTMGWDRPTPVTFEVVDETIGDQNSPTCPTCAGIWAMREGHLL